MFKAIGRLGSTVRSSINLTIFTNIFGSKSKKYGDLGNEDEEVFIDAQETIDNETDTENVDDQNNGHVKSERGDTKLEKNDVKADLDETDLNNTPNDPFTTEVEIVEINKPVNEVTIEVNGQSTEKTSSHNKSEGQSSDSSSEADTDGGKSDCEHEENDDEDDHHENHKDTKKIIKDSKQNNGIVHSASSSSMMKKVHRRMNSYSQRQYAKFDNSQDDETDNVVQSTDESPKDNEDSHEGVDDNIEQSHVFKSEKKTKRKKKIAKRTKKAVRGSWKWFKRSMVAYSYTFNFSSMFVVNIASAARK